MIDITYLASKKVYHIVEKTNEYKDYYILSQEALDMIIDRYYENKIIKSKRT